MLVLVEVKVEGNFDVSPLQVHPDPGSKSKAKEVVGERERVNPLPWWFQLSMCVTV